MKLKKKIIVVDDSPAVLQQVKLALGEHFEVIEAQNEVEGLDQLDVHSDAAMMICSVNMPRVNGLDRVEGGPGDPVHHRLPLVMLTTEGQAALIGRAMKAGAKGWIAKPFQPALLLAAVKMLARAQGG